MMKTFKFKPVLGSGTDVLSVKGYAVASAMNPYEAHKIVKDAFDKASEGKPSLPKIRWVFSEELKEQHKDSRLLDTKISFKQKQS